MKLRIAFVIVLVPMVLTSTSTSSQEPESRKPDHALTRTSQDDKQGCKCALVPWPKSCESTCGSTILRHSTTAQISDRLKGFGAIAKIDVVKKSKDPDSVDEFLKTPEGRQFIAGVSKLPVKDREFLLAAPAAKGKI